MPTRLTAPFKPLYFLAALGAGGLSVSFFMFLMFLVPHPETPMPTVESLAAAFGAGGTLVRTLLVLDWIAIAAFGVLHIVLLVTNIRAYRAWKRTDDYVATMKTNGEVGLLAIPLTYAMTMNVLFIFGALTVPGLFDVINVVMPFALLAFAGIGLYALVLMGRYVTRILGHEGFNIEDTNHFAQMMPAFAFSMIAVGFSSAAGMSSVLWISMAGLAGTAFFLAAMAAWILLKLPVSFGSILRKGLALEASPTLWMGIPIFTLVGIAFVRAVSGIGHNVIGLEKVPPIVWFLGIGLLVAGQAAMGLFGWSMMRSNGYFRTFVRGEKASIPSYGLICPGVAAAVLGMFFIHRGLVENGVVEKFSAVHIALLLVIVALQALTIWTYTQLNRKLLGAPQTAAPVAAPQDDRTPAAV